MRSIVAERAWLKFWTTAAHRYGISQWSKQLRPIQLWPIVIAARCAQSSPSRRGSSSGQTSRLPCCRPACAHMLYSYGLFSPSLGLYSYGPYSYGLYNYGLYSYGIYSYGMYSLAYMAMAGIFMAQVLDERRDHLAAGLPAHGCAPIRHFTLPFQSACQPTCRWQCRPVAGVSTGWPGESRQDTRAITNL